MNQKVLKVVALSILVAFLIENRKLRKEDLNIFKKENWKKYNFKVIKEEVLYFILPALIATLPMAYVSYFPPRAFLAYELMFMIVLANNVIIIVDFFKENNILIAVLSILLTLFVFAKFSPSTLAQIKFLIPYKDKVTNQYEEAARKGEKDVLVSKLGDVEKHYIHGEDYINISNFFPELNSSMPTNALIARYYGFDKVTAIGDNEYIIELKVDTEGINSYNLINVQNGENVGYMEYDDFIRYCIPKEQLGNFKLDCRENGLEDKIINYRVRSIETEITSDVSIEDLIITK